MAPFPPPTKPADTVGGWGRLFRLSVDSHVGGGPGQAIALRLCNSRQRNPHGPHHIQAPDEEGAELPRQGATEGER